MRIIVIRDLFIHREFCVTFYSVYFTYKIDQDPG